MSSSQPPRPRPTPSPATDTVTDGPPAAEESDVLAAPKRRRRLNPLRRRRDAGAAAGAEHDEWDDEYEDEYDDGYEDDEYDDDVEDEYDDELYDDEYDDDEDDEGPYDDEPTTAPRGRRRRRLLPRPRRRAGNPEPALEPARTDDGVPQGRADLDGGNQHTDGQGEGARDKPAPRRRLGNPLGGRRRGGGATRRTGARPARRPQRKIPVAGFRQGAGRRLTGARTGVSGVGRRVGSGVRRGWAGTRTGAGRAARFARTHWGRAAYLYLAFVGVALLVTLLLYWHSGFTYDECNSCGIPVLFSVSPWWLLIVPFNLSSWPMLLPLVVLVPFAVLNAELINRYSKRPQPLYPDWD